MKLWIGALGLASLVFLDGCMACTLRGCMDGVYMEALRVPASEASALDMATVEVCHNDVCTMGQLQAGYLTKLEDPIHTSVEVWTMDNLDGEHTLMLAITSAERVMQDGDTYSVTLTASDGREIDRGSWRAIGHELNYPNGERCGGACRNPVLEPI